MPPDADDGVAAAAPAADTAAPPGSVAHTVARLFTWARRAPEGLARVEYDNEFARRAVVDELRQKCEAAGIPFHEIDLPVRYKAAAYVVDFLLQRLEALPERCLVSLAGFATAFDPNVPLVDSLRVLNFNRDRLARFPVCQIWWMTPAVTSLFLQALPDLNSWFFVRLHLAEPVAPPPGSELLAFSLSDRALVNLADAQRQAAYLVERFRRALVAGAPVWEVGRIAVVAASALRNVGAVEEARELAALLIREMSEVLLGPESITASERDTSEALDMWMAALNTDQSQAGQARSLFNIAALYDQQNKYAAAESLYKRAIALEENILGSNHANVAMNLNDLAHLYATQGKYVEAEPLYKHALEIVQQTIGEKHHNYAIALHNLADLYIRQGRHAEAEPLIKQALEIAGQALGSEHPNLSSHLGALVAIYFSQGRYAEAEPLIKRAVAIAENALGVDHPNAVARRTNYARLLRVMGREAEAEAVESRAAALGNEHP